jgi:peptidoglycan L-alanyl-D-glutamate endopeptidase CwlK
MFSYSKRSLTRLNGVHPKIVAILFLMAKEMDLTIVEGVRSEERQNMLFKRGYSKVKYPDSKHNVIPNEMYARAVDVVPAKTLFKDISEFKKMGILLKKCANELNIDIRWGGDWNWKDYAHFELKDHEV